MTEAPFVAHRSLLLTVAYEILGSVADAEDVLQESWLRWATSTTPGCVMRGPASSGGSSPGRRSTSCGLRRAAARSTWVSGCRNRC